jgi:predicted site-specific integrase-resolvase
MEIEDLVGSTEIAQRLGVKPNTVAQWHHRGIMPAPLAEVSSVYLWSWEAVSAWARKRPGHSRAPG